MALRAYRRKKQVSSIPAPRKMKYVRIDSKTTIQVPEEIPDDEAIENFLYKTRITRPEKSINLAAKTKKKKKDEFPDDINEEELDTISDDVQLPEEIPDEDED